MSHVSLTEFAFYFCQSAEEPVDISLADLIDGHCHSETYGLNLSDCLCNKLCGSDVLADTTGSLSSKLY